LAPTGKAFVEAMVKFQETQHRRMPCRMHYFRTRQEVAIPYRCGRTGTGEFDRVLTTIAGNDNEIAARMR
jgi:hypothetical protein